MNTKTEHKFQVLLDLVHDKKALYLGAVACVGAASFFMYLVPTIGKVVIDRVLTEPRIVEEDFAQRLINLAGGADQLVTQLWLAGLAIIGVTVLSGALMYAKDYLSARACESTAQHLRNRLYRHLHHLTQPYLQHTESGDILQRCTSDIDTLREFLTVQVMNIGRTLILLSIVIPLMFWQHAGMTLLALVLVPFVLFSAHRFFFRVRDFFQRVDEAEGELTTIVQENLTGIRVVRAFARQDHENKKFHEKNAHYSEMNYQLICMFADFWSFSDLLCLTQSAIVLFGGGWLASQGVITVGTYFAFIGYTSLIIFPIRQLGKELSEAGKATVAITRIQEILEAPEETDQPQAAPLPARLGGEIEFDRVWFGYEPGKPVIKDLSFSVNAGETVAIVGPTGAGKSTLIQLLMRLQDYDSGAIRLDGQEITGIARKSLRAQIGSLLQEPFLFSRSLRENIKFSDLTAKDEQMLAASRAASVHHTIERFTEGYETVIGERGVSLSGGQKQRVTLARTLLKGQPILILDDTLSAVDTGTEQEIIEALHHKKGEQTLLIITHRISVCQKVDRILVIQNGQLSQQGSHTALMKRPGFYQELWAIQSGQKARFENELKTLTGFISLGVSK